MKINPPKPTKKTFPPSWKKWRCIKAGETLRASDRVVGTTLIRNGGLVEVPHSRHMGGAHAGNKVSPAGSGLDYPAGWYFRKVS